MYYNKYNSIIESRCFYAQLKDKVEDPGLWIENNVTKGVYHRKKLHECEAECSKLSNCKNIEYCNRAPTIGPQCTFYDKPIVKTSRISDHPHHPQPWSCFTDYKTCPEGNQFLN